MGMVRCLLFFLIFNFFYISNSTPIYRLWVLRTKLLSCEIEKKKISLNHCWAILQFSKKLQDYALPTPPHTHLPPPKILTHPWLSLDFDQYPERCSISSQRTKRKAKKESHRKSKAADTSRSCFCTLIEQFNKISMSHVTERKAWIEKRKVRVKEEMNDREQREKKRWYNYNDGHLQHWALAVSLLWAAQGRNLCQTFGTYVQ